MSKIIKILGSGCANCTSAEKRVKEVVHELNIDAQIIKVTDIQEIMKYDIMSTPAVVIDEKVVIKGKVPSKEEIMAFLVDDFASIACCADKNIENSNNINCC
ncbi:thioredoxin family protein [Lutibacter sp.]|uniref:thioredoxin family protein n=1 Tax=Lutibacter sp. TaxID=1925666 RepID=UPI001A18DBC5|nr:thioredoxin family protein [Lutibacter sp.]MBI9040333.1 TM0996/MTH895 family glutaredoxin-like protein [Lutibacter sp.]